MLLLLLLFTFWKSSIPLETHERAHIYSICQPIRMPENVQKFLPANQHSDRLIEISVRIQTRWRNSIHYVVFALVLDNSTWNTYSIPTHELSLDHLESGQNTQAVQNGLKRRLIGGRKNLPVDRFFYPFQNMAPYELIVTEPLKSNTGVFPNYL